MYKSCTPQICRKACCTTMTSVNGANARTNATIQTSRPVPSPFFGEMNAPYDCESSRPGAVPSGHYFQQMLTAAGVASRLELFCVWTQHLAHPQTCTKTETVRVEHFADTVKTCHTSSWERQGHFTNKQNIDVSQLTHCFLQISSLGTLYWLSMCQSWQGSPWCFSLHRHYYSCCLVNACPLHCLQLGHLTETLQCPAWTLESAGSPSGTDYLMPRVGSHGESLPSVILISCMLLRSVSQHKLWDVISQRTTTIASPIHNLFPYQCISYPPVILSCCYYVDSHTNSRDISPLINVNISCFIIHGKHNSRSFSYTTPWQMSPLIDDCYSH